MTTKNSIKDSVRDITSELAIILCDKLCYVLKKERIKVRKLRSLKRRKPTPQNRYEELVKKLLTTEPIIYKNRISDDKFEELLRIVHCNIQKQNTLMREALPARVKLKIVLHYLTTGANFQILSELYQVPKNSISQFLPNVCDAISNGLQEYIQIPHNIKDWKKIQYGFETKCNFNTCCGAIDGCHIPVRCARILPQNSVSLMCVVDADCKFIYVDIQRHEDIQDTVELSKTSFYKFLQQLKIPDNGVFVANSSFPLTDTILTPYESEKLTPIQDVFNYRLERANKIAENALGLLHFKFRVFDRPSPLKMNTIESALKAVCALHNWLIETTTYLNSECVDSEDISSGMVIPGEWRQKTTVKKTNFTKWEGLPSAIFRRHTYASRFVVKDILPWQWKMAKVQAVTF